MTQLPEAPRAVRQATLVLETWFTVTSYGTGLLNLAYTAWRQASRGVGCCASSGGVSAVANSASKAEAGERNGESIDTSEALAGTLDASDARKLASAPVLVLRRPAQTPLSRRSIEEFDDAGLQRILGPDDAQALLLDQLLEHL
jgi:hypothetical protein